MTQFDRSTTKRSGGAITSALSGRDLIVASNRQPYAHTYEQTDGQRQIDVDEPAGGLTAGLDPVVQQTDGTWIAWGDGDADAAVTDEADCVRVPPSDPAYTLQRLWLSDDEVDNYYYGYSNQVLWPLCHGFLENLRLVDQFWEHYRHVNTTFADAVADQVADDSLIWFQDYHLALAPRRVRSQVSENQFLMQFWHIPWPTWDTFQVCPHHNTLLDGLLANDLLGFHTERDCAQFLSCVAASLDDATVNWSRSRIHYDGQRTAIRPFPMGVNAAQITQQSGSPEARTFWQQFINDHGTASDTTILLGVERLDYTKGIIERIKALEYFWETHPEWHEQVTYIQKASKSRSKIPAYQAVQERVTATIERINRRFGTADWQPIIYTDDMLSQRAMSGLYHQSDVALVSSLRDGMNLVAKEYVAAQGDHPGVLMLSEFTGAHDQLGTNAVTINPYDTEGVVEMISAALTMPASERRTRMRQLREQVEAADLCAWMNTIFQTAQTLDESA